MLERDARACSAVANGRHPQMVIVACGALHQDGWFMSQRGRGFDQLKRSRPATVGRRLACDPAQQLPVVIRDGDELAAHLHAAKSRGAHVHDAGADRKGAPGHVQHAGNNVTHDQRLVAHEGDAVRTDVDHVNVQLRSFALGLDKTRLRHARTGVAPPRRDPPELLRVQQDRVRILIRHHATVDLISDPTAIADHHGDLVADRRPVSGHAHEIGAVSAADGHPNTCPARGDNEHLARQGFEHAQRQLERVGDRVGQGHGVLPERRTTSTSRPPATTSAGRPIRAHLEARRTIIIGQSTSGLKRYPASAADRRPATRGARAHTRAPRKGDQHPVYRVDTTGMKQRRRSGQAKTESGVMLGVITVAILNTFSLIILSLVSLVGNVVGHI